MTPSRRYPSLAYGQPPTGERRQLEYPRPGPPLPELPEGHVWLFHGTRPENARSLLAQGWHPPDPAAEAERVAAEHGVLLTDLPVDYAKLRFDRGLVSCSSAWRSAAGYARRGPESIYYLRRMASHVKTGFPTYEAGDGAILVIAMPWEELSLMDSVVRRDAFLPDAEPWRGSQEFTFPRHQKEVLLEPRVVLERVVGVERVRPYCDCDWVLIPDSDWRQRCSACFEGFLET